jgi:hypothetical protein
MYKAEKGEDEERRKEEGRTDGRTAGRTDGRTTIVWSPLRSASGRDDRWWCFDYLSVLSVLSVLRYLTAP